MGATYCPYPGYYKPQGEWGPEIWLMQLIHMLRRNVAMACYLYYSNKGFMYTDAQYDYFSLKLFLLQEKYPTASKFVRFMSDIFEEQDFLDTGFHIGAYCSEEDTEDARSIRRASLRELPNMKVPFEDDFVHEKLKSLREKISERRLKCL